MQAVAGNMQPLLGAEGVALNEQLRQNNINERDKAVKQLLAAIAANRKIVPAKQEPNTDNMQPEETEQQSFLQQALGLKNNPFLGG